MPNSRQEDGGGVPAEPGGSVVRRNEERGRFRQFCRKLCASCCSSASRRGDVCMQLELGQERKSKSRVCPFFERGYREQMLLVIITFSVMWSRLNKAL